MNTVKFFNACQSLSKMQKVDRAIASVCSDNELSYIEQYDVFDQCVNMQITQDTSKSFDHTLEESTHADLICDIIEALKKLDVTEIEFINNEATFCENKETDFVSRRAVCVRLSMINYVICYF